MRSRPPITPNVAGRDGRPRGDTQTMSKLSRLTRVAAGAAVALALAAPSASAACETRALLPGLLRLGRPGAVHARAQRRLRGRADRLDRDRRRAHRRRFPGQDRQADRRPARARTAPRLVSDSHPRSASGPATPPRACSVTPSGETPPVARPCWWRSSTWIPPAADRARRSSATCLTSSPGTPPASSRWRRASSTQARQQREHVHPVSLHAALQHDMADRRPQRRPASARLTRVPGQDAGRERASAQPGGLRARPPQ